MSRGVGSVQQKILEEFYRHRDIEFLTVADIAMRVYRKPEVRLTPANMKSVMRALRTLAARGLIEVSEKTRLGRKCWMRTGKDLGAAPPTPGAQLTAI